MTEIIFGASSGIGLETVKYILSNSDNHILGISRRSKPSEFEFNERLSWFKYSENEDPEVLAENLKSHINSNKIEVSSLILCAGILNTGSAISFKAIDVDSMFKVNFFYHIYIVRALVPKMLKNGGSIVAVSSSAAENNSEGRSIYNSTKSALESFVLTLGQEVGVKGIRANIVRPGLTNTEIMHSTTSQNGKEIFIESSALKRVSEPEDIASVIYFLISDMSKSISCATISAHGGARV